MKYSEKLMGPWLYGFIKNRPIIDNVFNIDTLLENNKILQQLYAFLNGKYFFDVIYNYFIIEKGFDRAYDISKVLDRGVIEALGPYGISKVLNQTGNNIAKLDTGIITTYALYITVGLLSLMFLVFSPLLLDTANINNSIGGLDVFRLMIIYISSLFFILW